MYIYVYIYTYICIYMYIYIYIYIYINTPQKYLTQIPFAMIQSQYNKKIDLLFKLFPTRCNYLYVSIFEMDTAKKI